MGAYPDGGAHRSAVISGDHRYRYRLTRYWEFSKPTLGFIMLNPSTADGEEDDATIIKCVKYARRWGYGGLMVCNLYALRSTDPRGLWRAADPVGPANDRYLTLMFAMAASSGTAIIAGWGNNARPDRIQEVLGLPLATKHLYALEVNQNGSPKHPLYIKDDAEIHQFGRAPAPAVAVE